jgi:hypothetical protein
VHHISLCAAKYMGVGFDPDTETMEVVHRENVMNPKISRYSIPTAVWHSIIQNPHLSIVQRLEQETAIREPVSVGALEA